MKIIVIGGEGTVGRAAVAALSGRNHELIICGRNSGSHQVDLDRRDTIEALFQTVGEVDAVVTCAGAIHFGPLSEMTEDQFKIGLMSKLLGQVNVVLVGQHHLRDGGSFTLTSGVLNQDPIVQGINGSTVNGALAGFVKATAIELPRGLRINAVSPGLLEASAAQYESLFPGHEVVPSDRVGRAYLKSVEGALTGEVIDVH